MATKDSKLDAGALAFPFFILTLTVVIILGYQMKQVFLERKNLKETRNSQTEQLTQVDPVEKQLKALADGVLELSKKGNKNADTAIDAMKKLGVVINPPAASEAATPAATAPAAETVAPKAEETHQKK